jgi:phosphoglycolate phosphatase-like HAD superfamily hydrolase
LQLLFWDIDGTLITTTRAGLYAFEQATEELYGEQFDFAQLKTAGMTDYYLASQIIYKITGHEPTQEATHALIRRYETLLAHHLAVRKGYVLPSVLDILLYLQKQSEFISLLLTGNTIHGSHTKLSYFKLDHFFDFTASGFGHNTPRRTDIAIEALSLAQQKYPAIDQIYVIGDTPHDIECGKAIGAKTIAVATGSHTVEELTTHSPWWITKTLPAPDQFLQKLS